MAGFPIYLTRGHEKIALFHQLQQGMLRPLLKVVGHLQYLSGIWCAVATILWQRLQDQPVTLVPTR